MKKAFSLLLVLAILAACFGATAVAEAAEVAFTPGTYEGKATSTGGELIVSVTVSDHAIESIEIVRCNDTDGIKNVPLERIPAQILENQSLNVDAVSGATLTSLFLRNAITDAVKKATDDVSGLNEKIEYKAAAQSDEHQDGSKYEHVLNQQDHDAFPPFAMRIAFSSRRSSDLLSVVLKKSTKPQR